MGTRNVILADRQERFIDQLVSQGRYRNASKVVREGLHLIETREAEQEARLKALRDAAQIGIEDIDAGCARSFSATLELRQHLERLVEQEHARRGHQLA